MPDWVWMTVYIVAALFAAGLQLYGIWLQSKETEEEVEYEWVRREDDE